MDFQGPQILLLRPGGGCFFQAFCSTLPLGGVFFRHFSVVGYVVVGYVVVGHVVVGYALSLLGGADVQL